MVDMVVDTGVDMVTAEVTPLQPQSKLLRYASGFMHSCSMDFKDFA